MNRWKKWLVKYNASTGIGTQSAWYINGYKHFMAYMLWDMYKWSVVVQFKFITLHVLVVSYLNASV